MFLYDRENKIGSFGHLDFRTFALTLVRFNQNNFLPSGFIVDYIRRVEPAGSDIGSKVILTSMY